jgi:sialate O-acetylesterase
MHKCSCVAAAAVLAVMIASSVATADVKLQPLFGDNMVLQRDMKVPVWGTAAPGEAVTVTISGQRAEAAADKDGKWMVRLAPMKAGGPFELTVAGKNTLTIKNVMVGEVWMASGQSNMEFTMAGVLNAAEEAAAATDPRIRMFTVGKAMDDKPREELGGQWVACDPKTVVGFSAVGYFFAREVMKKEDVAVGIINNAWGGQPIEPFMVPGLIEKDPQAAFIAEPMKAYDAAYPAMKEAHEKSLAAYRQTVGKFLENGVVPPYEPPAPMSPHDARNTYGLIYHGMIAPVAPYAIRGAIWYQGESNALGGRTNAFTYRKLQAEMIREWRSAWQEGDFPFLFVQLANFMGRPPQPVDSVWAELRESQTATLAMSPNTGMAVAIDIGDGADIHPKNKQEVGRRLGLAARALAYGEKVVYSGPIYDSMTVEGDKVRLKFKHVGEGLAARGEKLVGFAVAGDDRKFVWADAKIDGETVVVSCPAVARPAAVSYAWCDNPECNLYNKEGLPASPFRTDNWPRTTEPKPAK